MCRVCFFIAGLGLAAGVSAYGLDACSTLNFAGDVAPTYSQSMTTDMCRNQCVGSQFGIVQGNNCWCSNYLASSLTTLNNCYIGCPGWKSEYCAGNGYFGYIAQNALASQAIINAGGVIPSSTQPVVASSAPPSTQIATSLATSTAIVSQTSLVFETHTQVSTQIVTLSSPPSSSSVTSLVPESSPAVVTSAPPLPVTTSASSTTPVASSSSADETSSLPTSTWTPTPVTQTQLVTVSGAVVTQYVTSTPTAPATGSPSTGESNTLPEAHSSKGLSGGAVAGVAVGSAAGAILLAGLVFLCIKRARRSDEEGGIARHPSVLSRSGLLRSGSTVMAADNRRKLAPLNTTHLGNGSGPASAGTGASGDGMYMTESRRARGLYVDQRLNPAAIMTHANASRSSIGTLQDNQDYSRPLEVRNPDY